MELDTHPGVDDAELRPFSPRGYSYYNSASVRFFGGALSPRK